MRAVKAIVGCAALAAALAALPAQAGPVGRQRVTVGAWELVSLPGGACFVNRKYSSSTYFHLTRLRDGRAQLLVGNGRFDLFVSGTYKMSLVVGGRRRPIGFGRDGRSYNAGLSVSAGSELVAQLEAATTLEIDSPGGVLLERLDLGGLRAALVRMPLCLAVGAAMPDPPMVYSAPPAPPAPPYPRMIRPSSVGEQRPARPLQVYSRLFSGKDYPAAAVSAREEGRVGFRLQVDRTGRVSGCSIALSSGSSILDSATCRLLALRARFDPARDFEGRPTAGEARGTFVWRIPPPPPPPLPPGRGGRN